MAGAGFLADHRLRSSLLDAAGSGRGSRAARGPFAIVETVAVTALSSLETTFIFVIFIRLQREDLRNRFIRLAGSSVLHCTTLAMNDAAGQLSRFFWFRPCERFLRRHRCRWPLFHRRSKPDPLGRHRILAAVRFLLRPVERRWFSHGPGGGDRSGLGHGARNLGLVSFRRNRHRAGGRALALWPHYGISPIAVVISATF
jgi:hypothetical protein